jgi:single-strand DNA-binding protein
MANLNKVFLMGNLTRDPELRYTQGGTAIAKFGMAINRNWSTPEGEKKEDVCFVDVTAWGRQAEVICEYCSKGRPLFVEGRLQYSKWEGQDGQKRSKLEVVLEGFQFIGGRPSEGKAVSSAEQAAAEAPAPPAGDAGAEKSSAPKPPPGPAKPKKDNDIPF